MKCARTACGAELGANTYAIEGQLYCADCGAKIVAANPSLRYEQGVVAGGREILESVLVSAALQELSAMAIGRLRARRWDDESFAELSAKVHEHFGALVESRGRKMTFAEVRDFYVVLATYVDVDATLQAARRDDKTHCN